MTVPRHLIERYIDPAASPVAAWVRGYGVPVWALIGYLSVVDGDMDQVAEDYQLPREAAEAAMAYYEQHSAAIDAKLTLIAL